MGEKDMLEKTLEAYNDVFADIINGLLFYGRQVVREDDLVDAQTFSIYKSDGKHCGQDRDVAKYWLKKHIRLSFIGLENQTRPDVNMPLRVIGYDGAAYRAQLRDDEQKELCPVVTLVLYFGTVERWGKVKALKDRFADMDIPEEFKPFISDYKINVFELAWLDDETVNSFKSDFRDVVEFLRCKKNRVPYWGTKRQLKHVHEVLGLLKLISADERFAKIEPELAEKQMQKGGTTSMCDIVQMIWDDGERKGFENGERKGFENGERKGFADARDTIYTILSTLQAQGQTEELARVLSDRSYMEQLLEAQR